jgi:hypothetical protein
MTIENLEKVKKTLNTPFHYITVGSNKNIILNLETESGEKLSFTGFSVNECIKEAISYATQYGPEKETDVKKEIVETSQAEPAVEEAITTTDSPKKKTSKK